MSNKEYDSNGFSNTFSDFGNKYKITNTCEESFKSKYRMSESITLADTAPSFNTKINNENYKKINLSTQWL